MGTPVYGSGNHRDDLQAAARKMKISPAPILDNLGIDEYCIDYVNKKVYLRDRAALDKVAAFLDQPLPEISAGFGKHGWMWLADLSENLLNSGSAGGQTVTQRKGGDTRIVCGDAAR